MKNDTVNNETGVRSVVNRPFWLASGTVSGADVTLYVSPGRMRFPYSTKVVYSGQPNNLTFGGLASRFYTVFLRSDQTYYVSGSTTATVPGPKYHDSEYLGQVSTGASLSTANLQGPWNQGANYNHYEQRGEAAAITAAVPVAYINRPRSTASNAPFNFTAGATASGIGWLTYADRSSMAPISMLGAYVRWVASGALSTAPNVHILPSGLLQVSPLFSVVKNPAAAGTATIARHAQTYTFVLPQNPDGAFPSEEITSTILAPGVGVAATTGYQLLLETTDPTTAAAQMRIKEIRFYGIPGYRTPDADNSSDPA